MQLPPIAIIFDAERCGLLIAPQFGY